MTTTRIDHAWTPEPYTHTTGPAPAWVQRVAEWIGESPAPEAHDLARDMAAVARRMGATPPEAPGVSGRWLFRLADWVEADSRPQGTQIARQLREWAATAPIIRLPD